jgi:hypothetical protein
MTQHSKKVLKTFFDFYVITAVDTFCGEKTLNHANKAKRVTQTCKKVVDEMYEIVLESLRYAVTREFRHYHKEVYTGKKKKLIVLSRKIKRLFGLSKNSVFRRSAEIPARFKSQKRFLQFVEKLREVDFESMHGAFDEGYWSHGYGGKKWAKACKMLLELPLTHQQKVLWIDKVLDLYHNNGHLLNKSMLSVLSKPKTIGTDKQRNRYKTALNYRRYAQTLSELTHFSSEDVRNLFIANKRKIPSKLI